MGNVLATVLDKKTGYGSVGGLYQGYYANLGSVTDYYPGGFEMPGRNKQYIPFRFGNQNQEKDNEIYGEGNVYAFKYRFEDTRLNRFFSVDPLSAKYPWNSSYAFGENRLTDAVELEGLEAAPVNNSAPTMKPASAYDYSKDAIPGKATDDWNYIKHGTDGNPISRWWNTIKRDWNAPTNKDGREAVETVKTLVEAAPVVGQAAKAVTKGTRIAVSVATADEVGTEAEAALPRSGKIAKSLGAASRSEMLAKKLKLNINSPTTRQVLNSLDETVESFISQFRKPSIKSELPGEFLKGTVEDALKSGNTTVRKLLIDGRFVK